jgi:deazaflavin-dependent oxidoreductase (nitroreductase family)
LSSPNAFQRWIQRLTASRVGSALLPRTLNRLDRGVAGLTGGRHTATAILAGVPVLTVETIGARTGRRHLVNLLAIPRDRDLILVATAFGSRKHPAWYHNLRAHPVVDVRLGQVTRRYFAREATGEERDLCWEQATAVYPGYADYVKRAGRVIPILLLTPDTQPGLETGAAGSATGTGCGPRVRTRAD